MQINWPEFELVSTFHKLLTKPSNLEEVGSSANLKKAGSMCPAPSASASLGTEYLVAILTLACYY
jgi:hypothetical protein